VVLRQRNSSGHTGDHTITPIIDKIAPTQTMRAALANISWAGLDRFIRLLGALLVGTAVARALGPSRFGVFSYAYAAYALFNIVSNLGLDLLVIKDIALDPDSEGESLGTAFVLKVAASLVTTVAAVVFVAVVKPHDRVILEITALLSIASIFQGLEVVGFCFQAKLKSRLSFVPTTLVFLAANAARVVAIVTHAQLLTFAWIAALEIALTQIFVGLSYASDRRRIPRWRFNRTKAVRFLHEGYPLLLSSFLIVIYTRSDQIILGHFCPSATVGDYSAAVKVSEVWYSVPLILCGSVMPQLARLRESHLMRYQANLQKLYNTLALLGVIVAILVTLFGKTIITLAFGSQYGAAYPILSVYIWANVFVFVGIAGSQQMIFEGLAKVQLQRSLAGAILNVMLNFALIPLIGAIGSAIATLIVQVIVSFGLDFLDPRTRGIFWLKTRAYLFLWLFDRKLWSSRASDGALAN
jgi:O-antigen/teichoic acid export membrane protein